MNDNEELRLLRRIADLIADNQKLRAALAGSSLTVRMAKELVYLEQEPKQ